MVPVVETKRYVAVFLHFKDHHVLECVNRPGRYEDSVARLRRETGEVLGKRFVCNCPA